MIRVVLLDVAGTLMTPYPSIGRIYADVAARHGIAASPDELARRFRDEWKSRDADASPMDRVWWGRLVRGVFAAYSIPDRDALFDDLYRDFARADRWRIYEDVRPTLERLRGRGLRLAVASNWDERLPHLLADTSLAPFFDAQFVSFSLGVSKPDPRFFEAALRHFEAPPQAAVHAGDDPVKDLAGARRAGLHAYFVDRSAGGRGLKDLEEFVKNL